MAQPGDHQHGRAVNLYIAAGVLAVLYVILLLAAEGEFFLAVTSLLPFLVAALIVSGTIAWAAGGILAQQQIFHHPPVETSGPTFGAGATRNRPAGPAPRWTNDQE